MKNKKMVATLASLCLIVVAVVAAVVGVLAAVNQSVASTMSVKFVALNVNASVDLKSIGPNSSGARTTEYAAKDGGTTTSVRFYPYTAKANSAVTLEGENYVYGWKATTEDAFYGVAIYRFEIKNFHTGHVLTVTPDIASAPSGLNIIYYVSASGDLTYTDLTETRNPQTGALTAFSLTKNGYSTFSDDTAFYLAKATAAETPTTMYAYMIVGLASLDGDINNGQTLTANLANILSFTLTDGGQATVPTT